MQKAGFSHNEAHIRVNSKVTILLLQQILFSFVLCLDLLSSSMKCLENTDVVFMQFSNKVCKFSGEYKPCFHQA